MPRYRITDKIPYYVTWTYEVDATSEADAQQAFIDGDAESVGLPEIGDCIDFAPQATTITLVPAEDHPKEYIQAEAHSDDRAIEISFNAVTWFEQASDDEIIALSECDWGGDYAADAVADYYRYGPTSDLFSYLDAKQKQPGRDSIGFECSVDEDDAIYWLREHRPDLAMRIEEGESAP